MADQLFRMGQGVLNSARAGLEENMQRVTQAAGGQRGDRPQLKFTNTGLDPDLDQAINQGGDQPETVQLLLLVQIVRTLNRIETILAGADDEEDAE